MAMRGALSPLLVLAILALGLTIAPYTYAEENIIGSWTWKSVVWTGAKEAAPWYRFHWTTTLTIRKVEGTVAIIDEIVAVNPLPREIRSSPFGNNGIVGSFKEGRLIVINPFGATYDLGFKGDTATGTFIKPGMAAPMYVEFTRDRAATLFNQYFSTMAHEGQPDPQWIVEHATWCVPVGTPTPPHNGSTKTVLWEGTTLECLLGAEK